MEAEVGAFAWVGDVKMFTLRLYGGMELGRGAQFRNVQLA